MGEAVRLVYVPIGLLICMQKESFCVAELGAEYKMPAVDLKTLNWVAL